MKKIPLLSAILLLVTACPALAQPSLIRMKANVEVAGSSAARDLQMTIDKPTQAGILFSATATLRQEQEAGWLQDQLGLRQGIDILAAEGKPVVTGGFTVTNQHQYYKGIKVEHGVVKTTVQNGKVAMMQMEFYPIADTFKTTPVLSEAQALQKAIQFTGAEKYMWDDSSGTNAGRLPKGELVIMQTYLEEGQICLAWKFDIYARLPLSRAYVYVDARTGRIVLDDNIIKHSNVPGMADTHYSGTQQIITDNGSGVAGRPYWLYQLRNNQEIETNSFNFQVPGVPGNMIYHFVDGDNNWTANEFNNANADDAALDVHFNMQIVSDYWKQVHNRNGWDDNYGKILSYIHVKEEKKIGNLYYTLPMDNAFWGGNAMYFGDGRNEAVLPAGVGAKFNSVTSLDVSAHEMGHAVCQATAGLVYRWESGALNEGFSDIWAAAIENFGVLNNPSISPNKSTWLIGEEITINYLYGLRDMADPDTHGDPSTFKGPHWIPATFRDCRVPESNTNDDCGVHTNSGVLNKWFFLITQGGAGTNTKGTPYNVVGMGFNSSQKIAYLTELNLPPNASFSTAKTVSINAATTLFGGASFELGSVKDAWKAVGVDTSIYDMSNTPAFTTNNFISIGVGSHGNIWAGTAYNGLYKFNDTAWVKRPEITNVRINDIKADKAGGIWIAQSGTQGGGSAAIAGGVNYFPDPYSGISSFYTVSTQTQVPSRNARCMYVDTFQLNDGANPKVWVATQAYALSGNTTSGMLGQGLYSTYKQFHPVFDSLNILSNTAGISTVGGTVSEVWGFAQANYGKNQILTYNPSTNFFIRSYDHNSVPLLPANFVARAIYFDAKYRAWVGLANGGVMVFDEHQVWHSINLPALFPAGSSVNPNAIAGDPYGDVYIGTTAGLVFFDHGIGESTRLDSGVYYHLYTNTNGLPSANVNAIAYDTLRQKLLIATDNGIAFWDPPCLGTSCDIIRTSLATQASSNGPGNWSNPATWSNGKVPDSLTNITLMHPITVDVNAKCRSMAIMPAGAIHVNAGVNLTIFELERRVIPGIGRKR